MDGMASGAVTLRALRAQEAEAFWRLMDALDHETGFMMYEPGERVYSPESLWRLEARIEAARDGLDFLLAAEADGQLVGYLAAERGCPRRIRHTAYVVTGIRTAYRRRGIGSALFQQLDGWAAARGITRLELTVMCANTPARRLYEKCGYVAEGVRKNAMLVDGSYVDELYMAKLL